jgi:hypothetical protein
MAHNPDRQFAVSGRWALASDGLQWMLQCWRGQHWQSVSFVRSTRDILARCMREKGCPPEDAERLLAHLPATFDEWKATRSHSQAVVDDFRERTGGDVAAAESTTDRGGS